MRTVNIHEAKTKLSQLIEAVEAGEEFIIARAGKPVAHLTSLAKSPAIKLGVLKGKIPEQLLDDIVEPLSEQDVDKLFGGQLEP